MLGALDPSQLLGLLQLFAQLGKPPSVSGLGMLVEHLARITQAGNMYPCLFELFGSPRQALCRLTDFVLALACDSSRQIEHVEFNAGMTQQMGEVSEPLGVL